MKKHWLILLLVFSPSLLFAWGVMGVSGGVPASSGSSCSTWTVDQSQTTHDNTGGGDYAVGQSFQVSTNGTMASVTLTMNGTGADTQIIECRVGTSADMSSSYIASASVSHTWAATGNDEIELEFSTKPSVSTGTTYYVCFHFGSHGTYRILSDVYANGNYMYNSDETSWNLTNTVSDRDLWFKVSLCD